MTPADQPIHFSVPEGIKQLATRVCNSTGTGFFPSCPSNALDSAWTILLDLDPSRQALPDVQDRRQANATVIAQACDELCQQHRTGDAAQLQQLVQGWLSETHYVTRVGAQHDPQPVAAASRFAAAPLTEQHAVLSLLLALRGSCPASRRSLAALPALGSSLLKDLQQEAQAAAAAAAASTGSSGSGWVAMSAHPEELLTPMHEAAPCQQRQPDPSSSWVSPAVGAMQLLQQMPLDVAAHASTLSLQQQADQDAPDEVMIAAACGADADSSAGALPPLQGPAAAAVPLPLLQQVAPQMQRASCATLLGRPLLLQQSPHPRPPTSNSGRHSTSVAAAAAQGMGGAPVSSAGRLGSIAHSAAAAEAAVAVAAAAAVQPRVKTLMALSSKTPSEHNTLLRGSPASSCDSSSGKANCRISKDGETRRDSDTALMRDVRPALRKERRVGQDDGGTCTLDSGSSSQAEAELVSTACLALQGVWSAVEALWRRVLQMSQEGKAERFHRKRSLCKPVVQQQLLIRVLHTAELRLRLKAFLQHFQHATACSSSNSSTYAGSDGSSSSVNAAAAEAILTAFVNAVAAVLAEQDASLAAGQLRRLRQLQQQGRRVSLLQLLVVQREMTAQLQQLAELCWCTVQEFVDQKMFLKANSCAVHATSMSLSALPASTQTSSSMNWQVLRHAQGSEQAWAAVAALRGAAAAAYEGALQWPRQGEAAAAAGLAWAPSSWQLRQGIEGGHALLERLCAGIRDAGPEATPLLRHLFAAAVQPVLHSLRSWAFLPDTQAAEAAAEATAMASFTAGSSNSGIGAQLGCIAAAAYAGAGGSGGSMVAVGGPFAAACGAGGAGVLHSAGGHGSSGSTGGGGGGSSAKSWSGSRAADSAMRQCLQQAWSSMCDRLPGCPGFLAHVQEPARVAGLQLHLLQLLGAPGQELAERLGWLAELEQQELSEVLSVPLEGTTAAAGAPNSNPSQGIAGVGAGGGGAMLQLPGFGHGSVGLLGGSGASGGGSGGILGGVGHQSDSLTCNMTPQQLKQCAAVAADFRAARQVEVQRLLQDLAQRRVAHHAAHELWLAGRQEERRAAEEARARLQAEAAMRRKQRQQRLLLQQQEDIAAAETRRLESRLRNLTFEQQLLHEAALKEHKQALQQLRQELANLDNTTSAAAAVAAAAELPVFGDLISVQVSAAAAAAAPAADVELTATGRLVSGFATASGAAAAELGGGLDVGSIVLDFTAAAGADNGSGRGGGGGGDSGPPGDAAGAASTRCTAGGESSSMSLDLEASAVTEQQQQQQQQQQQRQRGTWGRPVVDISPAAGAPSGQQAAGPLAVIGSAAAAAAGGTSGRNPQQQQAAGRRSNSQPRHLPGMGRPVSAHSRRNSSDDDGSGGLFGSADAAAAAAAAAGAGGAAAGAAGSGGAGSRAGRGGAVGGISSMSSILGGFGASSFGAGALNGRGNAARGKWGVPVVPGPAAGLAAAAGGGGAPTLQRRASTGDILVLGNDNMGGGIGSSSSSSGMREQQHSGGQQGWQGLQRQSSGGVAGRPRSGSFSGAGSRPSTPRGWRGADAAAAAAAASRSHHQGQLQRQQSWHHMQQQQMLLVQEQELSMGWADGTGGVVGAPVGFDVFDGLVAGAAGAGSGGVDSAAAAAAASTGWLLSRSQQRGGRAVLQEGQGNSLIVAWLMQQNGFVGAGAGTAGAAAVAGEQSLLSPAGDDGDTSGSGTPQQHGNPAAAAAGVKPGPAAPLVACLEVLLVQPLQEQCRLTTVACWSLLLQEHRLLQRLSTIQGLFFQQQGDWVVLLCDALEPLLLAQQHQGLDQHECGQQQQQGRGQQGCGQQQQQQQQQQGEGSPGVGPGGVSQGLASPVVLQLLLEGAVQQSCLAKMPEAECMSLQAVADRALGGWSSPAQLPASSFSGSGQSIPSTAAVAAAAAGATDCLVLGYEAPWPVSLLLGQHQLQQYADVFSVLLRLRRLQQQLMKQWQPLNHRASSSSSSTAAGRRARHASDAGALGGRSGSSGGGVLGDSRAARRATWHGAPGQGSSCLGPAVRTDAAAAAAAEVDVGLSRLQDLRRWHALALHCIDSLLGYMLGELSGQQQSRFEAAVGRGPVELHVMLQAHEQLLAAAREVCFLPPAQQQQQGGMQMGTQQQQQQQQASAAGAGKRIELTTYALVESAWQLQQHVAQLLETQGGAAAAGADQLGEGSGSGYLGRSAAGGGRSSRHGFDRSAAGAGAGGITGQGRRVLARAPSGFKEGSCCSGLAAALEGDAAGFWEAVEPAGVQLERLVEGLKQLLKHSMQTQVGHPLVGLAGRLGV